jgi:hypothetical protein
VEIVMPFSVKKSQSGQMVIGYNNCYIYEDQEQSEDSVIEIKLKEGTTVRVAEEIVVRLNSVVEDISIPFLEAI